MHMLWMLIIGYVLGVLAKHVVPGDEPGGTTVTALIGIAGAVIASFLGLMTGMCTLGGTTGLAAAAIGAVALLALYRTMVVRSHAASF